MFRPDIAPTRARTAFGILALVFHAAVRHVRKAHGNAILGLIINIVQTVLFIAVFYTIFRLLGLGRLAIRGDLVLYAMSGIFMFMTHAKALSAVAGAENSTSAIMKHAPMNPIVSMAAAALGALYLQVLSAVVILFAYHAIFTPITIHQPVGTLAMFLLSWASGAAIGTIFLALRPWNPPAVGLLTTVYSRANMFASGKMMLANATPGYILIYFTWNPLFHTIDQGRGFIFENYHPRTSTITYPVVATLVCLLLGLMGEYFTRKRASISWGAGR
jgi:ABC-type polysaccharide/polyol phosphate export permease